MPHHPPLLRLPPMRRLRPYQLILCLGSIDCTVNSTLATDPGLRLLHVDASRAKEIANTVMALFLGLLRRTHLLSRHALSGTSWLGSVQPLCRGMRQSSGLVLGIIGRSASTRSLATRSLAFKINVLYFDVHGVFSFFFSNFLFFTSLFHCDLPMIFVRVGFEPLLLIFLDFMISIWVLKWCVGMSEYILFKRMWSLLILWVFCVFVSQENFWVCYRLG